MRPLGTLGKPLPSRAPLRYPPAEVLGLCQSPGRAGRKGSRGARGFAGTLVFPVCDEFQLGLSRQGAGGTGRAPTHLASSWQFSASNVFLVQASSNKISRSLFRRENAAGALFWHCCEAKGRAKITSFLYDK